MRETTKRPGTALEALSKQVKPWQRDMGAYVFLLNVGHYDKLNRGFKSSLHEICNDRLNKQENRGMP
ncbi:hypothetical protein ROHU_011273 [Labeo rohita]|uniref:Uncharacterized protein n=1 Tax=Labeo rohita TaxID=84645 RepID=A0A498LM71_LABRO|nr:hypothetical protein ROHU_011273 [Labeo rohita]